MILHELYDKCWQYCIKGQNCIMLRIWNISNLKIKLILINPGMRFIAMTKCKEYHKDSVRRERKRGINI